MQKIADLVEKFDAALAAYQTALTAENEAYDRFAGQEPEPPRYLRHSCAGELNVKFRGKTYRGLNWMPSGIANLKRRIAEIEANPMTDSIGWNQRLLENGKLDLRAIEAYLAERDRVELQCGVPSAVAACDAAAGVLDALAAKIMAGEPTSLVHLAAQARCVMHDLYDDDAVNFPERVIAFCER